MIDLGEGVTFTASPSQGYCETRWRDGHIMGALRPATAENVAEARAQGYGADVWASLVEHEIAHTLVARHLWGRWSPVLRHECGAEPASWALRTLEEGIVLSLQAAMNGAELEPMLIAHGLTEVGAAVRRLAADI